MARYCSDSCRKILIIGLDGVPWEMICGSGGQLLFPGLQKYLAKGFLAPMAAAVPAISPVSWAGFMTGRDAGSHGIYGFVDLFPHTYRLRFPNFSDLALPAFFDQLGSLGKRSVIINLPGTYPARPMPGTMVSGFVAPELERAVYPYSLLPILRDLGYRIEADNEKGRSRKDEFLAELHTVLQTRMQLAGFLWKREKWDIFTIVFTESDRLNHFFFDAFEESDHPFRGPLVDIYREIDNAVCELLRLAATEAGTEVIILSDHGFCRKQQEVYLQPILERCGYFINPLKGGDRKLDLMSADTRAFALDPGRIFIHSQGRYPCGRVSADDYHKLRCELRDFFLDLRIQGRRVIEKTYFKEEIYRGPLLAKSADLILTPVPGFELRAGNNATLEHSVSPLPGMHSQDNAFFFSSCPRGTSKIKSIHDLHAFIFGLFGLAVSSVSQ